MPTHKHAYPKTGTAQPYSTLQKLAKANSWQLKHEQYCKGRWDGLGPNGGKILIKLYNKGTLWVDTAKTDDLAWLLDELGLTSDAINTSPLILTYPHTGSDESGKGDYFGPLVVAGVRIDSDEQAHALAKLGVEDSKQATDAHMAHMVEEITNIVGSNGVAIWRRMPEQYNTAIAKAKANGMTLNHVLASGHAQVIAELVGHNTDCQLAIIDQFAKNHAVVNTAVEHELGNHPGVVSKHPLGVHQEPRAESAFVSVAAASMVARNSFLTAMDELSDIAGTRLPKGAGPPVLRAARQLVRNHDPDILKQLAKWHFATTQQVLG